MLLNLRAPSTLDPNKGGPQANLSPASGLTFPANCKALSKLAPGTKPFPAGVSTAVTPSDNKEKWPTVGLEPLPFDGKPGNHEARRSLVAAAARISAADLEPLPFGDELLVDEFSNYIDEAIQFV